MFSGAAITSTQFQNILIFRFDREPRLEVGSDWVIGEAVSCAPLPLCGAMLIQECFLLPSGYSLMCFRVKITPGGEAFIFLP